MCFSPIWINNRRYYQLGGRPVPLDVAASNLALHPMDISRMRICVPCGKCDECLRELRNAWFVRLERELAYCESKRLWPIFITITIKPSLYDAALADPASFIRKWLERVRHVFGRSVKHFFVQEFGTHPKIGTIPRLHFHGFIFNCNVRYDELRKAVSQFGWIWIGKATLKRARYVVKYVCKSMGDAVPESVRLRPGFDERLYRRRFVSPHVGDYLGDRPRPSYTVTSWRYTDFKYNKHYDYSIPRYYDRYLSEIDKLKREISSADAYSRFFDDPVVFDFVQAFVKRYFPSGSFSRRDFYTWISEKMRFFSVGSRRFWTRLDRPYILLDKFFGPKIFDYWQATFNIT